MKSNKKLLLSLSFSLPFLSATALISCKKGEPANEFAKNFVLGNNGIENYKKDTKTLDLSKTNLKIIPQGSFSYNALLRLFQSTTPAANPRPDFRAPDGIYDLKTQTINIEKIILPESLEVIEKGAFEGLGLTSIQFSKTSNKLTRILDEAFANNQISELDLPKSVIEIGEKAFFNNEIKKINLDKLKNIKKLSAGVFAKNQLETIYLSNIVSIEESALAMNKFSKLELNENLKVGYVSERLFFFSGENKDIKTVELSIKNEELKKFLKEKLEENKKEKIELYYSIK